ncbi:hypothetical protein [Vibrio mediterranei]|uniref:hypothetical protein n=1 Tax=Vibrio mediterranei TaxID=689 RepID=UPI004067BD92
MNKQEKRRLRKLPKLIALVDQVQSELSQKIHRFATDSGQEFLKTSCILFNSLAHERLVDNDFADAKLVAGKSAFGFSKSQHGMIECIPNSGGIHLMYGGVSPGFQGHCWVTIPSMNVIVDLTLKDLNQRVLESNMQMGINDDEFLLEDTMIVSQEDLMSYDELCGGAVGVYYESSAEALLQVKQSISQYASIFQALR